MSSITENITKACRDVIKIMAEGDLWHLIGSKLDDPHFRAGVASYARSLVDAGVYPGHPDFEQCSNASEKLEDLIESTIHNPDISREIGFAIRKGLAELGDEEIFGPPRLHGYPSILKKYPQLKWIADEFVETYADYLVRAGGVTLGYLPEFIESIIDREDLVEKIRPDHIKAFVEYVHNDDSHEILYFQDFVKKAQKSPHLESILYSSQLKSW